MNIETYLKAGTPAIALITHEEARAESDIAAIATREGYNLHTWSITEGLYEVGGEAVPETESPDSMLLAFVRLPEKSILIARDLHSFITGPTPNPLLVRRLRDVIAIGKQTQRTLVMLGCRLALPAEIEKEVVIMEYAFPTREQLGAVLSSLCESAGITVPATERELVLDASAGLTTNEAEAAFALSFAESREIKATTVQREKANTVKKNGLLEIVEAKVSPADIGGLSYLKRDLAEKRGMFTKSAREYGLPTPRGLLVVGQPGTGKSLTASATASIFNLPLLRLEAGRLFGSLVGQSEANWRAAFATVKAVAPCILWIDEVDGLFAGGGSGHSDGGTTQRVLKAILQDMQIGGDGIFFVFTANDIDRLPDPLIDRLDVWSVDLPTGTEREDIWRIHIAKRNRDPKKFNLTELARATDGFSGRQIEQVWVKGMSLAFNDGREVQMTDLSAAVLRFTPTSKTMAAVIEARRARLAGKATPASEPEKSPTASAPGKRKLSAAQSN